MRDVLGFSVTEVADQLASSPAAINSAHQRARSTLERRRTQARSAGMPPLDPRRRSLLERYVASWERGDLDGLMALLSEDVVLSMPPMPGVVFGPRSRARILRFGLGTDRSGPLPTSADRCEFTAAFGLYGRTPKALDTHRRRFRFSRSTATALAAARLRAAGPVSPRSTCRCAWMRSTRRGSGPSLTSGSRGLPECL